MQTVLTGWLHSRAPTPPKPKKTPPPNLAIALFADPPALRAWTARGYKPLRLATVEAEAQHSATVATDAIQPHLANAAMIVAFPGCTDLSAAGARWWKQKRLANPNFQEDAAERIRALDDTLKSTGVPYVIIVSAAPRLRKLWKAPTAIISPHEYGGWLNRGEPHPCFPDVVPPQDAYKKRTFIYTGNGFILPHKRLVTPTWAKRRRKGKLVRVSPLLLHRKHKNLRRLSPLGFLKGSADTNSVAM